MTQSRLQVIVALLLLLPILYVASYLTLVVPGPDLRSFRSPGRDQQFNYRWRGSRAHTLFWPIEQVDRQLRHAQWEGRGFGI